MVLLVLPLDLLLVAQVGGVGKVQLSRHQSYQLVSTTLVCTPLCNCPPHPLGTGWIMLPLRSLTAQLYLGFVKERQLLPLVQQCQYQWCHHRSRYDHQLKWRLGRVHVSRHRPRQLLRTKLCKSLLHLLGASWTIIHL